MMITCDDISMSTQIAATLILTVLITCKTGFTLLFDLLYLTFIFYLYLVLFMTLIIFFGYLSLFNRYLKKT